MEAPHAFLIMIVIGGAALVYDFYTETKRREIFLSLCEKLGFANQENPSESLAQVFLEHKSNKDEFPFFLRGQNPHVVLLAERKNVDGQIFIGLLRYRSGTGKNKGTRRRSFCLYVNPSAQLPALQLYPEGFFMKILQSFGYQDIDLPQYPEFSKKFLLRGTDPAAIMQVFTPSLVKSLEDNPKICFEAHGHCLVLFREDREEVDSAFVEFLGGTARLAAQIFAAGR